MGVFPAGLGATLRPGRLHCRLAKPARSLGPGQSFLVRPANACQMADSLLVSRWCFRVAGPAFQPFPTAIAPAQGMCRRRNSWSSTSVRRRRLLESRHGAFLDQRLHGRYVPGHNRLRRPNLGSRTLEAARFRDWVNLAKARHSRHWGALLKHSMSPDRCGILPRQAAHQRPPRQGTWQSGTVQ